jgi:hypothetical protein
MRMGFLPHAIERESFQSSDFHLVNQHLPMVK